MVHLLRQLAGRGGTPLELAVLTTALEACLALRYLFCANMAAAVELAVEGEAAWAPVAAALHASLAATVQQAAKPTSAMAALAMEASAVVGTISALAVTEAQRETRQEAAAAAQRAAAAAAADAAMAALLVGCADPLCVCEGLVCFKQTDSLFELPEMRQRSGQADPDLELASWIQRPRQ